MGPIAAGSVEAITLELRYPAEMLLSVLLACGPAPSDTAPPPTQPDSDDTTPVSETCFDTEPHLAIGTGESAWVPLEENDPVTMVHGPQGGWHIIGSAAVHHTNALVQIDFSIVDVVSEVAVAAVQYDIQLLREADPCIGYVYNLYGYLDVSEMEGTDKQTPAYEMLGGNTLMMQMQATDSSGRLAEASLPVLAALDPFDQ